MPLVTGAHSFCLLQVPQAIKDHYSSPPVQLLPEHIKKMQEPLPLHSIPIATPTAEEQEEVRVTITGQDGWMRGGVETHRIGLASLKV